MKIVIMNGPKGCGKDTLVDILVAESKVPAAKFMFKDQLYVDAFEYLQEEMGCIQLRYHEFLHYCTDRDLKEEPTHLFGGLSPRALLIHVSEVVIKPTKGERYFGEAARDRVIQWLDSEGLTPEDDCVVYFSDGGFPAESLVLGTLAPVTVIQLSADWTQFDSTDSRGYVTGDQTFMVGRTWNDTYRTAGVIADLI